MGRVGRGSLGRGGLGRGGLGRGGLLDGRAGRVVRNLAHGGRRLGFGGRGFLGRGSVVGGGLALGVRNLVADRLGGVRLRGDGLLGGCLGSDGRCRRRGGGGGDERHRDGRAGARFGRVAERLQDRGEILARAADQGGHADGGHEAVAVGRAVRRCARGGAGPVGDRRADQVGEPLQDVDAHRPLAADPEAGGAVEALGDLAIDLDRGAAGAGEMRDLVEAALVEAAVAQGPELGRERAGRRLQQGRQEDVVGAEADAVAAQGPAPVLVETAHLVRHLRALQDAERLDHLVADPLGEAGEVGRGLDLHERAEQPHDVGLQPRVEAALDLLAMRAGQAVVRQQTDLRGEQLLAGRELGDGRAGPADRAVVREHEGRIGGRGESLGPRLDLARERLLGGAPQCLCLVPLGAGIGNKQESVKVADMLTLDGDVTVGGDLGFEHRVLSQAPHQDACAPVDEAAREAFVQGVGQPVLYPTRLALPMFWVAQPVGTVRHEGPGAPLRDPAGQRVDVAVGPVDHRDLLGEPRVGDAARHALHEEPVELGHEVGVHLRVDLAVIRDAADVPQAAHRGGAARHVADVVLLHEDLEGLLILAHRGAGQARFARVLVEARLQAVQAAEGEIRVAPLQDAQGIEVVALQPLHQLGLERRAAAGGAEGAVREVAPRAPRDLAHLGGRELAEAGAVVLPVGRERDVIDVEIEAHPDRVGGHEVVDVARLVHLDLGVAGPRRQGAEHHRGAPALAADQLGDRVDLLGRERHDGGAPGQPRQPLLPREGELREPRPGRGVDVGDQVLDQRQHGRGADQQGLFPAADVEQAVGEDVAAVHVGGELDLVDGHERHVEVPRHRLDGADPVARPVRLDLLLAGDEGDLLGAHLRDDAQVDLPGEQPQGQPDHAGRVREHPLDGEMRLAGVGRPEDRGDAAGAGLAGQRATGRGAEQRVDGRRFLRAGRPSRRRRGAGGEAGPTGRPRRGR